MTSVLIRRLQPFVVSILLASPLSGSDAASAGPSSLSASRIVTPWDHDWRFSMTGEHDFTTAATDSFDDSVWRVVRAPHDWSTEEPYRSDYASGNGFAAGGIAWYRKHFKLDPAVQGRIVTVEFDGIYANSEIWLNSQFVGGRPFGYSSFALDLTRYLNPPGVDNVIAVRVDHSRLADSRFYTGSGIYRHVRLVVTDPLHVAHWGVVVSTPSATAAVATICIGTTVQNSSGDRRAFTVQSDILNDAGRVVASAAASGAAGPRAAATFEQTATLASPRLWSIESPSLYTLRTRVLDGTTVRDETLTSFGVRTFAFDPDHGFTLNGKSMKLKGVCLHHDGGSVGSAVPAGIWERRLRALKEIGANAIRTSHNPPAPELLDLCDRLGFLVMDEGLDEFAPTKNKWVTGWNLGVPSRFGAGEFFAEWGARDVADMVRRDRNHPSIIQWSIGNEVDTPNDPYSDPVLGRDYRPGNPPATDLVVNAKPLIAAVKANDTTRPVTMALASPLLANAVGLPELLDIVGYNYREGDYAAHHAKYPQRVIYGSENGHDYSAWAAVRDNEYMSAQFLWTGVDYLGEAARWPSRGNTAGLLDLCGFKKPIGWFRQSLWSDKPMVYLCVPVPAIAHRGDALESWNWAAGSTVNVACYTNCAEVELTLNGRSLGVKPQSAAVDGVLTWEVPYAPGILKAIARTNGRELSTFTLRTAGAPARIVLTTDASILRANGEDIAHLEFAIVDANGILVPNAAQMVALEIAGPVELLGFGNADETNTDSSRDATHPAFRGRALAIVRTTDAAGAITIKATAPGLKPASVQLHSQR
jgi:beta-galactosidase